MKKTFLMIMMALFIIVVSACGSSIPDDENTLEIYAIESGYGVEWLKEAIKLFEEENPDIDVHLWTDIGIERATLLLQAGPGNTTADLMFTNEDFFSLIESGSNALSGYDYILADLTDMFNANVPGENILYKDKMNENIYEQLTVEVEVDLGLYEDRNFFTSWGSGVSGILYNTVLFEELNLTVPKTTDELIELSDEIIDKDKIPFVSSKSTNYWDSVSLTFWQQYETIEKYNEYWYPTSMNSYKNFDQAGRLYTLQLFDQLLNPVYKRTNPGSIEYNFTEAQAQHIIGNGLMIPNGLWFYNEMGQLIKETEQRGIEFATEMMRTPVISALSDKLSYWNESNESYDVLFEKYRVNNDATAKSILQDADAKLRAIIDFVDGDLTEKPEFATEEDIAIVRKSRSIQQNGGAGQTAIIPAYSNAIPAAKRFLQYLATDRAIENFAKVTGGGSLPFKFDYKSSAVWEELTPFAQAGIEITSMTNSGPHWSITPGAWKVGLTAWISGGVTIFMNTGTAYSSPQTVFKNSKISEAEYRYQLQNAGII